MEHISTYFKIENDVLYIKGQRDALLKTEEKIREAEEKIRKEQQKFYEEQQKRYEAEQLKLETEQLIKQNQNDVVTNLVVYTNLTNEIIANIANVTLSFVEDLRKTLTEK